LNGLEIHSGFRCDCEQKGRRDEKLMWRGTPEGLCAGADNPLK